MFRDYRRSTAYNFIISKLKLLFEVEAFISQSSWVTQENDIPEFQKTLHRLEPRLVWLDETLKKSMSEKVVDLLFSSSNCTKFEHTL